MSGLTIYSAQERASKFKGIKGLILGKSGIGKTSLLWTLDPEKTLFVDLEAGDLAVKDWSGDSMSPRTWQDCRCLASWIGGINPARQDNDRYGKKYYEKVCSQYGSRDALDKYDTIFIDSITVASRWCFEWCQKQPEAFSQKKNKPDMLNAYGMHSREMIDWVTQIQYAQTKNVWFVGILDRYIDEYNNKIWAPQIDGSKTAKALPGIIDQLITMTDVKGKDDKLHRIFVCKTLNKYDYPAKDRSRKLNVYEKPHLGDLMNKINSVGENQSLHYESPNNLTNDKGDSEDE